MPAYLTKARVLEAFCVFRDFITEDRLYAPADLAAIRAHCAGKKFLSFDESGFTADMRRHLDELFPQPSIYESPHWTGNSPEQRGTPRLAPCRGSVGNSGASVRFSTPTGLSEHSRYQNATKMIEPRMKHGLNTDRCFIRDSSVFHPWLILDLTA
ncbi:MAG TPA: hypothetical protein VNH11_10460 [Pirellulales bacterium]|nr:hypothetical protein [Pirellulales bacterium]